MKCPHCTFSYKLTWNSYFNANLGYHICPECLKPFRLRYSLFSFSLVIILTALAALPFGFLGLVHRYLLGNLLGINDFPSVPIIYFMAIPLVMFPVDKFISDRFNKSIPLNEKNTLTSGRLLKQFIAALFIVFLLLFALMIGSEWIMGGNRFEIYSIAQDLKRGMPREEVINIIKSKKIPHASVIYNKDGSIFAYTSTGLAATFCELIIGFTPDGLLKSTSIHGEDSQKFPDAPSDIQPVP